MQTLTVTKARQNLGVWLQKAIEGDDIGVILGDRIVALRPVEVYSADYVQSEYGLKVEEAADAAKRIVADVTKAKTVKYTPGALSSGNPTDKKISRRRH